MAKDGQRNQDDKTSVKVGFMPILLSLLFVAALLTSLPTILLAVVGLLPTGVAFIIDRTEGRQNTQTVGWMNFAGLWPYLWMLWSEEHSISRAMEFLGDAFVWLVIYGAASFGWTIFVLLPPIIVQILDILAERRVESIRENQREIIAEWGKEVAETQPPKKQEKGEATKQVETVADKADAYPESVPDTNGA